MKINKTKAATILPGLIFLISVAAFGMQWNILEESEAGSAASGEASQSNKPMSGIPSLHSSADIVLPGSIGISAWGWGTEIPLDIPVETHARQWEVGSDFFMELDHRQKIMNSGPRILSSAEQLQMMKLELERRNAEIVRREEEIKARETALELLKRKELDRKAGQ